MTERILTIGDPSGLHARPAARFVQIASRFVSRIAIEHGGRQADAKSLIALLALGVRPGSEIVLSADGPDADEALATLTTELAPFLAGDPDAIAARDC